MILWFFNKIDAFLIKFWKVKKFCVFLFWFVWGLTGIHYQKIVQNYHVILSHCSYIKLQSKIGIVYIFSSYLSIYGSFCFTCSLETFIQPECVRAYGLLPWIDTFLKLRKRLVEIILRDISNCKKMN